MALRTSRRTAIASATASRNVSPKIIVASALAHGIFVIAVLRLPISAEVSAPSEESIAVEIIAQIKTPPVQQAPFAQGPALKGGKVGEARERKDASVEGPDENPSTPDGPSQPEKPTRMLSGAILADRHNSQAREALSQLAPAEQTEQLCNLEAMAQVAESNSELKPDHVVAYAMADTRLEQNSFWADGAAVHSGKSWIRLRFKCDLTPDRKTVTAFEFFVGEPIPREQWSNHSLPDEDASYD
jgi:hypothetical protein